MNLWASARLNSSIRKILWKSWDVVLIEVTRSFRVFHGIERHERTRSYPDSGADHRGFRGVGSERLEWPARSERRGADSVSPKIFCRHSWPWTLCDHRCRRNQQ